MIHETVSGLIDSGVQARYLHSKLTADQKQELVDATNFLPPESPNNARIYCIINNVDRTPTCTQCQSAVEFRGIKSGFAKYCSPKCSQVASKGRQPTPEAKSKRKRTMHDRYGVEHNFQRGSELYDRKQETIRSKYGADNVSRNSEVMDRKQQNIIDVYGKHFTQTDEYKHNTSQTLLDKYGVSNPSHIGLSHETLEKLDSREWLLEQHHVNKLPSTAIASQLGVSAYCVDTRLVKHGIEHRIYNQSYAEREIVDFIKSLVPNATIETNVRHIIPGLELDIYLPEYQLAIEYDGIFWHSDHHDRIDRKYHSTKTDMCDKVGINLLHIFENEWTTNRLAWEGILRSKLSTNDIIYARQCNVVELTQSQAKEFCIDNHLQKHVNASVRYGLEYRDQIVACMTFGRSRYDKNADWELLRFCTQRGTTVVGGASRLYTKFNRVYHNPILISYADRRHSNGRLYDALGMARVGLSDPNYYYWKAGNPNELHSRIQFQKHKLSTKLDSYDPSLTEYQNMRNAGYYRIWDCGNIKYSTKQEKEP